MAKDYHRQAYLGAGEHHFRAPLLALLIPGDWWLGNLIPGDWWLLVIGYLIAILIPGDSLLAILIPGDSWLAGGVHPLNLDPHLPTQVKYLATELSEYLSSWNKYK